MTVYTIDFEGSVPEFGSTVVTADSREDAEMQAKEYVADTFPEMSDVVITRIQEELI